MFAKRLLATLILALGLSAPALAADNSYEPHPLDKVLGKKDAPVTIIEYASLTCSHCANFHKTTLPEIKKNWVDTGKAKIVYRDFPFEPLGMGAAMLSHCAGPERYFGFLDVLFKSQERWASAADPVSALKATARLGGIDEQQFNKCLSDQKLMNDIRARQEAGKAKYKIQATPSFIVGGKLIEGAVPYAEFDAALKAAAK